MSEHRGNKTQILRPISQTSLFRIGLIGHLFFNYDELRLSFFFTVVCHSPKISLSSCLIGFDQLYTGRTGGSPSGLVVTNWHSMSKVA